MKNPWIFLMVLGFAGAALAQQYKWIDKDGKTRYGDTPPPGVKATLMGAPASGSAPAAAPASPGAAAKDKDAKKGPLTPAEQAQEYRLRQEEAKKEREKEAQERKDKEAKAEDCTRTKEYVMTLESGQRISRTSPSGERYYMEDDQRAQEIAKARQLLQNCK
jgi:Domain of unknown function (DUF4124)